MPHITDEALRSRGREATVQRELVAALVRAHTAEPDLTYEEILAALLLIASRQVEHMRTDGSDEGRPVEQVETPAERRGPIPP